MKLTTEATIHYCDGCSGTSVQLKGEDLPRGFYLDVTDLTGSGADAGKLFVCQNKCILPAFRRRHEIWSTHV
jgi:hypothetical protein